MANKKISLGMDAEDFDILNTVKPEVSAVQVQAPYAFTEDQINRFAEAALRSLDWNQIGMGVDQAAKLCWQMADAMVRNKP